MFETIAMVLRVVWLLGWVTSTTLSRLIHILLVVAIVPFLLRLLGGKRIQPTADCRLVKAQMAPPWAAQNEKSKQIVGYGVTHRLAG
jgi:hypothetical protein